MGAVVLVALEAEVREVLEAEVKEGVRVAMDDLEGTEADLAATGAGKATRAVRGTQARAHPEGWDSTPIFRHPRPQRTISFR